MDFGILKDNNINIQAGISYCGDEARYVSTIQRYYRLYDANCVKMKNALDSDNIAEFTTLVHSLKSNSKMIGANELSELAAWLENAGKEGNYVYINECFPQLLVKYEEVIGLLKPYGEMEQVKIPGVLSEQEAMQISEKLLRALDDYDGDASMPLIDELLKFPFRFRVKNSLKEARMNIEEYLFDEALEIVREAIKEIQV